jgi:hypothetical protein
MITINPCDPTPLLFDPSPCAPSSTATSPAFTAVLSRHDKASITLAATLTPAGKLQVSMPTTPPARGIWNLSIGTPTCCCHNARVFIDTCQPVTLPGKHSATGDSQTSPTNPITVCC